MLLAREDRTVPISPAPENLAALPCVAPVNLAWCIANLTNREMQRPRKTALMFLLARTFVIAQSDAIDNVGKNPAGRNPDID
jgi:hypothetical protein